MELPKKEAPEEDKGKASTTEWGRRATLHVGTFNHKPPAANPSGRRRFSEDVSQNSSRQRPISGIAARCRAWTMRFHRNSTAQRDGDIDKWKTSPYASSLAINMSLLVGTADVLSDIAERAFFTALQTNDVEEVSLALDRFCHVLPQSEDARHSAPSSSSLGEIGGTIRRDSIQTEILLRNCEHLLGKFEKGGAELLKSEAETAPFHQNALHTAVYYESADVVELLLSRGFDPNVIGEIRPERKYSDGRESVLRFIVPPSLSGCDLKKAEVDDFWLKRPVIFLAAQVGNHGILKTLLKYGANVNVTDDTGDCPLHFIVHNLMQNVRCVSLLIEQGISLYHCNKEGKTPLDINPELKHLYKRIVLDHLEPLSPDNSSKPSEEVIFKRRLRSIGGTSDQMKQSFGALTLSKLRLRKTGTRAEMKMPQREDYDGERQEHKRKSVGRRMSFAFRNLFDKKKRYHFDDINDPDVIRNIDSASYRSQGETSRVIERRRCVSFNDTVDKYPHDSEQSIQTLSYMVGDRDCAMMIARRLPRCWPRILTLATTLGPDVCRNTVLILSGVSNMILNRDSPDKRRCKTLEQPVAVLKLAVGILSTNKSKATTILRNVVCNMIEFITEEIGRTDSTHKKMRRKVGGSAQWTAVAKTHSHIKRQSKSLYGNTDRPRNKASLKVLYCYGQKEGRRRPFCKKCGINLSEIHRLRDFNVRNRQKRKCRSDSISRRKTIGNFRTILGFELLMDCLIGLEMCRTSLCYPSLGRDISQPGVESRYYIPNDKNHGDYPLNKPSGMIKSFRNIVAIKESPTEEDYKHLCAHGLVGQSSRPKDQALSPRVHSSEHDYNGEVARLQTKVSNILRALFSDKRHVTTSILQSCFKKLLSREKSSSEEFEENLCLNILCILEVVFLHPPNADAFQNLDLSGSLLEFLEGRVENTPRSQGLVIELQVFRLLIFTAHVSEAVSISQSLGLQHVFVERQEDGAKKKWKRKKDVPERNEKIVSLCDFLHILLGIDRHFLSPEGLNSPPWSIFLEVLPFMVHTAILLNGIQAYLRMCYQMVLRKADSVDVAQTAEVKETFQFLDYWLQEYPQDFVCDSVAEKSGLSLLSLFSDLKLKHHPTVILLQSMVGQIKSTIFFQNFTKKVPSSKRAVNRTSSLPPQLQGRSSPGRLNCKEKSSSHGSNRSLDSSSSPYSRRSKNLWNLLLWRNFHVSQSVDDPQSLERTYCEWQEKVSCGDLSCSPEVAAKLASLQIQLEDLNNSCKLPSIGWLQETDLTSEESIDSKSLNAFFSRWSLRKKGRNSDPNIFGSNQDSPTSWKSKTVPHAFSTVPRSFRTLSARVLYPREGRNKIMSCSEVSEDPLPELEIDHCLPPAVAKHPHVQQLLRMHLKEYVSNSWEGRESARVDYLKAKYISICEEIEASQQVMFPVKYVSRSGRKRTHLLHISNTHISLLQADSKSPVERHPLGLVEDWHVTFEKESGGYPTLVVTFSDNVGCCWRLVVNTPQQVKHICTTLSSVMEEVQNNNNDGAVATTPTDTPSKDTTTTKGRRQRFAAFREKSTSVQSSAPSSLPEDKELLLCVHYLQFPVEAASILTNAEFKLFQEVKSSSYVNYIRNGGVKLPGVEQQTDRKTIHDLKDRCEKVTEWVVETISDVPQENQFPVMQQFVELANTCWNMGNFQAVVEILEALLSDRLQDVLEEADNTNISSLVHLHQAIIEGEADYQDALDKSLRIPGCKVVPYFGVFLDQLVAVWEEPSPALSMSMLEMEREITEWDWWTRDGDMPTASPGLLSTEKMSQAYWILEDLRFCQRLAKQNATLEDFGSTDSPTVTSGTYEKEDLAYHSCSEDFDDAESIEPLPKTHGLEIVPQQCMDANLSALHCMLRGSRLFRVDDEGSKYSECFLRLDESNAVLIWTKVQQKYLPNGSLSASLSILSSKYSTSNYIVGGLEEGFLDLTYAKELLSEADELDCSHISHSTDYELFPFAILYGTSIIENKLLYFLAPKNTCALWKAGLGPIIRAIQMQQRAVSDKRSKWLMKQFLNAFFFKGILGGPTALEAVQIFGGRHPTLSKMKDKEQTNDEEGPTVFQPKAKLSMKKRVEVPDQHKSQKTDTSSAGPTLAGSKPKKKMKKLKGLKKLKKKKSKKKEDGLQPDAEVTMDTPDEESDDSDEDDEEEESDGGSDVGELDREEYLQDSSGVESVELTNGDVTKKEGETAKERIPKNLSFYSRLTFPEFAQLFQSFSIRTRKDIKDIFEPFSYKLPNTPPEKTDQPSNTPDLEKSGVPHITRNILSQTVQSEVSRVLDFLATSSITNNSTGPPQTMNVQVMGAEELQGFLLEEQGEELSMHQVESLIRRHEPNAELRSQVLLSFEGFARLLMDKENFIFNHEEASNKPLTSPLSHYYIKSSHNTYLTGHQLRGESSVELYAQVLLTGCRCVELDCWDGDDGWPIIYHGHTLTTKISFKEVVEAINKAAFVTSKYPVILSIENHCSILQQTKMATIFKEVLGDKLVSTFLYESDFEEDAYLPSPEQLKEKIIVKNKKIKPSGNEEPKQKTSKASQFQNREMSEDEEDDEMFEDAYDELSSAEDNTSLSVETKKTMLTSENSLEESIQHSEKSAIGKGKHKRNASGSQSLLALAAAAEEVQKKKKKKEPVISPELSELVNYCQSVKFPGFGEPEDDESDAKPVKGKKGKKGEAEDDDEEDGGKMSKSKKAKKGDGDEDSDGKSKKKKKEKKKGEKDVEEGTGEIEENDSDSKSKKKTKDKDKKKKSKKEDKKKEEELEGGADLLADGEPVEEEDSDGKSKKKKKEKEKKKSKKDKGKNEDGAEGGDLGEIGEVAEDGDSDSKSKKKSKKEKEKKKKKKDSEDKEDADEKKRKKKEAKEKKKREKEEKKKKKAGVEEIEEVTEEQKEEAEVGDEEGHAEELPPIENGHGDENEDEGSDSDDQEEEEDREEVEEREEEEKEEDHKESAEKEIGDEEKSGNIPKEEDVDNEPIEEVEDEEDEEEDSEHLTTERGKYGEETEDDVTTSITNGTKDEDLEEDISEDVAVEKDEKIMDENDVIEKEDTGEEEEKKEAAKEEAQREDAQKEEALQEEAQREKTEKEEAQREKTEKEEAQREETEKEEKVEVEKFEEVEDEEKEEEKEGAEKDDEGREGSDDVEMEEVIAQDEEPEDNTESEKTADMDTSEGVVMTKKERKEAKKMEKVARKMEKESKKAEVQRDTLNRSKKWKKAGKVIGITSYVSGELKESSSADNDPPPPEMRIRQLKSRTKSCHISSLNESSLKKMFRKFGSKFVQHCEYQLIRTYPAGMRIDSSNYNPILYWACGIQLVALNYQKEDLPMHIQTAFFEQNGCCGYILKPEFMISKSMSLFTKYNPFNKTFPGLTVKELTIEVVSGQHLNPSNPTSSCYIELEVIGIPCDCNKYKTKPVSKNMVNPIWNEEFSFRIALEELAFLRLAVIDNSSSNVVAQRIIPIRCLRRGYRHVRLRSPQNVPLELSTLFVLNRLTEVLEDELQNSIQKKELLTDLVYYYVGRELAENSRQNLAEGSCVGVYGIENPDEETLLWTTGDTKVGELLAEAIGRACKPLEDLDNYVLEEEAVLNFRQGEEVQTEERALEAEENVYEVQAAWNGKGRFVLKPAENVTSTTTSHVGTFLVSVYTRGVSSSMDNMSFEISVNATTPDVIARVLAKAGRLDVDPEQYVLYEEKSKDGKNLNLESSKKSLEKLVQRAVGDDEKLWDIQNQWITGGINGRFSVRDKFEEKSTSNSKLRRVTSLRQRKQKIMQSAAVQAKKAAASAESQEGTKGDTKGRKVSKLKIWKSS